MNNPWFVRRDRCPVCAATGFRTLYECPYDRPPVSRYLVDFYAPQGMVEPAYLEGASYILLECGKCAAVFQKDIPGSELMERLYEHWIDPGKALVSLEENCDLRYHAGLAQEIMAIMAFIGRMPSSLAVLDYGMGWGKWALMAKAFGCDAYGTELSVARVRHAVSNGLNCIAEHEIAGYRFDFINTEQVFEHIPEPLGTLDDLKRALKPDGIIKISVPPAHDIGRRLALMDWRSVKGSRNSLNAVAPLEHINCFRRESILAMANAAGMHEVLIPMRLQWAYATDWCGLGRISKGAVRPLYRNVLKRQNCVFLRTSHPVS